MYPDARQEYQFVRGLFLYAALGNQELEGKFPRIVPGDLGPFDLDNLMQFIYAENGNPIQQRNLAFTLKQDATKQNPWIALRAKFWLAQCRDESSGKDLEKEVPDLFSHRVDLTKGMASVGWTKAELEGIRKWGYSALLGSAEGAWKLHKAFNRKGGADLMEWSNVGSFSVMDQIALLKRAPKGVSREEMAVFWLLIAAENGHVEAQSELGSHWVVPDYFGTARAVFWLEKASKAGSEKAKKNLELLEQTNQPKYVRDIVEIWKKAAIRP
jgi:TPR repeat protein